MKKNWLGLLRTAKGTIEQRRQASKTLVELARLNGNGALKHDDAYHDKWKAIREEWVRWDEEDRQAEGRPIFARRF